MQMEELRKQWITSEKEYREGEVLYTGRDLWLHRLKKLCFMAQHSACTKQN